jgi:hypothetical protein
MTARVTDFSPGRRWWMRGAKSGYARGWWVILGNGENYDGNPSAEHKRVRWEPHPGDAGKHHLRHNTPHEGTYSRKHIRKYAVLEPLEGES